MTAAPAAKTYRYRRPVLYKAQLDAIFHPARYAFIEASTKSGKTVGCMAWIVEKCLVEGRPGRNGWWVAPVYPVARIAFRRLKRALPHGMVVANDTQMSLTFPNGAVLWFKSGEKADNLYGEDVWWVVIDEATRVREESWHAVRSTITATRGVVRVIGNVKGKKNWAYKMALKAKAGAPGMHYARLTWRDAVAAGIMPIEEVLDARDQLPEAVWRELYEAEAAEDQSNPFGIDFIRRARAPLSPHEPVVWGWDLARSFDWTVGIALDAWGTTCRYHRWQMPWRECIERIERLTGDTYALLDSGGVGDAVVEIIQRPVVTSPPAPLEDLYDPNTAPAVERPWRSNFVGHRNNAQSKQALMEGLAVAIQSGQLRHPGGRIQDELEAFEFVYTRNHVLYSAPEGLHDDCVSALSLAWRAYITNQRGAFTTIDVRPSAAAPEDAEKSHAEVLGGFLTAQIREALKP